MLSYSLSDFSPSTRAENTQVIYKGFLQLEDGGITQNTSPGFILQALMKPQIWAMMINSG
jgi:hypothetical protein